MDPEFKKEFERKFRERIVPDTSGWRERYDNLKKEIMREKIIEKLKTEKESYIVKMFSFSMEDLQDNPEECLREISDYLESIKKKYRDFEFLSWVDEETFAPKLLMIVYPADEIASQMTSMSEKLVAFFSNSK
jgi:hypothetical protein